MSDRKSFKNIQTHPHLIFDEWSDLTNVCRSVVNYYHMKA